MIRDHKALAEFERNLVRNQPVNVTENFGIVDALYQEAVHLGIFPLKDPLDGLDTVIHIAKVVNHVPATPR
jgi:hypothetical protein